MSKTTDARYRAAVPDRITLGVLKDGYAWTVPSGLSAFVEHEPKSALWRWEVTLIDLSADTDPPTMLFIASGEATFLHQTLNAVRRVRRPRPIRRRARPAPPTLRRNVSPEVDR